MLKSVLAALVLTAATTGGALAQADNTFDDYDVSSFEMRQTPVAVATHKKTGKTFNVVKLENGKMMVLMSAAKINAFSPFSDDSEMMYSGHTGTTR